MSGTVQYQHVFVGPHVPGAYTSTVGPAVTGAYTSTVGPAVAGAYTSTVGPAVAGTCLPLWVQLGQVPTCNCGSSCGRYLPATVGPAVRSEPDYRSRLVVSRVLCVLPEVRTRDLKKSTVYNTAFKFV